VDVLRELYSSATMRVRLHKLSDPISIQRGVRQGDTISPKLFTAVLENDIKTLAWDRTGININGVSLSHLRFADDIVLFAETPDDLQNMIQDLYHASLRVGLRMNMSKTKVMANVSGNSNSIITVGNEKLEAVDQYVYLGHMLSFDKEHQRKEISRRIQLGWAAFNRLVDILKPADVPQCLKTRLFNQCVLPTMTYGAETWTLTHEAVHKIRVAQRAMERAMLGIKLQDRVRNVEIRRRTKVRDVGETITKLKWSWAGHVARQSDCRWTKMLTDWWPLLGKRSVGRPPARWVDDIRKIAGQTWMRLAQNRDKWRARREAYAQQWAITG
jgi:hypothetical protein